MDVLSQKKNKGYILKKQIFIICFFYLLNFPIKTQL